MTSRGIYRGGLFTEDKEESPLKAISFPVKNIGATTMMLLMVKLEEEIKCEHYWTKM